MSNTDWDIIIKPQNKLLDFKIKQLWRYKDLLGLFVKRDFISVYKQTILGPLWFFIQPILTTVMFTIVFGTVGKLSTDGMDDAKPLFYLAGLTLWNYFSDCLINTSETFVKNQNIFGKVFFPRLIVPLSVVVSSLIKFGIQFLLFIALWVYYYISTDVVNPNSTLFVVPLLVVMMAGLSLGFGIIFSSITTKYKDMKFLLSFGVQLLMYASSVVVPLSSIGEKYQWIVKLNPMVSIIEAFKYAFLGTGHFNWFDLLYSFVFMVVLLIFGIMIFNKVEKSFMDTI